ncbi:hypothetical protein ACFSQ7_02930 [Paenibacillus rhizoplanae]
MEKAPKGTILIMAILIIGTMAGLLNQSSMNTALPNIMGEFRISASTVQWLTTAFCPGYGHCSSYYGFFLFSGSPPSRYSSSPWGC